MWAEHGRAVTGAGRQCFTMFHVELSARGAAGHNLNPTYAKVQHVRTASRSLLCAPNASVQHW